MLEYLPFVEIFRRRLESYSCPLAPSYDRTLLGPCLLMEVNLQVDMILKILPLSNYGTKDSIFE